MDLEQSVLHCASSGPTRQSTYPCRGSTGRSRPASCTGHRPAAATTTPAAAASSQEARHIAPNSPFLRCYDCRTAGTVHCPAKYEWSSQSSFHLSLESFNRSTRRRSQTVAKVANAKACAARRICAACGLRCDWRRLGLDCTILTRSRNRNFTGL